MTTRTHESSEILYEQITMTALFYLFFIHAFLPWHRTNCDVAEALRPGDCCLLMLAATVSKATKDEEPV